MSSQRQLHVNAVIDTGAQEQGERHQVEQIPRPTGQIHQGDQTRQAEGKCGQAKEHFGEPSEREPQRAQQ